MQNDRLALYKCILQTVNYFPAEEKDKTPKSSRPSSKRQSSNHEPLDQVSIFFI